MQNEMYRKIFLSEFIEKETGKKAPPDLDSIINGLIADAMMRSRRLGYKQGLLDAAKLVSQFDKVDGVLVSAKIKAIADA